MENKTVSWDEKDILTVVEQYQKALGLLDAYDHQTMERPQGHKDVYRLTYQECKQVIASMSFGKESQLFGNEKDDSFQGSIAAIYQTFGEKEVYPSLEEKAANLLYFVTKNHSFSDGNKRIAAAIFLYFLHKNGILFADGRKRLDDSALVSLTILIAQSKPSEKDMMTRLIMNCLI
ncbi:Fic/DOC family protein [Eubacteriaceae bacterium CHKCI005]|nr:Fic/DOC family protein [Eubacteriaceae bacterium CHKCI005]